MLQQEPRRKDGKRRNPSTASANEFNPLRVRFFFFFFFLSVPNAQKMTRRVRGCVQQCDTTFAGPLAPAARTDLRYYRSINGVKAQ